MHLYNWIICDNWKWHICWIPCPQHLRNAWIKGGLQRRPLQPSGYTLLCSNKFQGVDIVAEFQMHSQDQDSVENHERVGHVIGLRFLFRSLKLIGEVMVSLVDGEECLVCCEEWKNLTTCVRSRKWGLLAYTGPSTDGNLIQLASGCRGYTAKRCFPGQ